MHQNSTRSEINQETALPLCCLEQFPLRTSFKLEHGDNASGREEKDHLPLDPSHLQIKRCVLTSSNCCGCQSLELFHACVPGTVLAEEAPKLTLFLPTSTAVLASPAPETRPDGWMSLIVRASPQENTKGGASLSPRPCEEEQQPCDAVCDSVFVEPLKGFGVIAVRVLWQVINTGTKKGSFGMLRSRSKSADAGWVPAGNISGLLCQLCNLEDTMVLHPG